MLRTIQKYMTAIFFVCLVANPVLAASLAKTPKTISGNQFVNLLVQKYQKCSELSSGVAIEECQQRVTTVLQKTSVILFENSSTFSVSMVSGINGNFFIHIIGYDAEGNRNTNILIPTEIPLTGKKKSKQKE